MNDALIIEKLGGVKVVATKLGYNYTTVYNWMSRGISKDAKVEHPDLFMPKDINDLQPLNQQQETHA